MNKSFKTGLAILLPAILTVSIMSFFINFLTKPFLAFTENLFSQFDFFQKSFLFMSSKGLIRMVSQISILTSLFLFILLIGFLGKVFLIDSVFSLGNALLHRLPFFNKIYKACQDIIKSILSSESKSFSQVVLVPFPTNKALSIGLVSNDFIEVQAKANNTHLIPVFVPGTPNPSVGFMLMFKKEDLIFLDMKVDEAMKFIVSGGIVVQDFTIISTNSKKTSTSCASTS